MNLEYIPVLACYGLSRIFLVATACSEYSGLLQPAQNILGCYGLLRIFLVAKACSEYMAAAAFVTCVNGKGFVT